jgi:hypothetical protein
VHQIAGVDRLLDADDRPDGRATAAGAISVLDVVVDEREAVDQLETDGARKGRVRAST